MTFRILFGYVSEGDRGEVQVHYITHIDVDAHSYARDDTGAHVFYDEEGKESVKYRDSSIISVDTI